MNINVTHRNGETAPFDADRINRSIELACRGLTDPISKVTQIATETQLALYDGVTTEELDEATINSALQNVKDDPEYEIAATRLLLKTVYKRVLGDYETENEAELTRLHKEHFKKYVAQNIADGLFDERMANFDLDALADALDLSRDHLFKYSGISTLLNRYATKDTQQKPAETPQYFFMRVAMGLSYNEKNPTEQAIKFYDKMSRLEYIAGGSTNISAGTARPALSNCFLLEIHDDIDHIAQSISDIIKISKSTGGIGASITKLRASGSPLSSNNTTSSGPTPFAKIIDTAIRAIQRGGKKKGALCFYMENWHLDFDDYVDWRHNAGDDYLRMRTANTAVWMSDEFMNRVHNDQDWYMFDPKEVPDLNELYGPAFSKRYQEYIELAESGKMRTFKKVPAREQYRKILVALQTTSHPWLTWKDTVNMRALNNNTGTIHMSNLCTEICLPQDKDNIAVCNLASVNLTAHIKGKEVDWQRLEETVRTGVRHLDNLIDINELPIPQAAKSDRENRAIGLGMMGFADVIEKLGFSYDSQEAYDFTDRIFEFMSYMAIDESANLAQERGSYAHFEGSAWSKGMVPIDSLKVLVEQRGDTIDVDLESKHKGLNWDILRRKVQQGMRNATLMAVAPNANIGLVAGTTPGIDPRFAQVFSRNKISGKYLDINTNLVDDLKERGLWEKVRNQIIQFQGDIEPIAEIPQDLKDVYKTSFSTSPYAYIEVASRAQKWVDQALSRNMYLETRDINEIMNIYSTAWKKGVKTTYYLHMKPRHTAEQSTISVNKRASLGKSGFAGLRSAAGASSTPSATPVPSPVGEQSAQKDFVCPVDPQERLQCDSCQ
ncbi:MAG: ribonucleoside-diphosphate reductase subunit alpha [Candidatus Pacebacteria bacterium]|nr:ribonucleoside-diphosphate reductase subunit alpha [Candidatus Paceibacterota bacterium]MCD8507856.1 ribonucleoside-diphosphate reductase subunit alpha [Candidatus Paceibacterota bacterium]MCD8563535.1 ribonucleoside-diphosphate reductase subunit alpha [Candidatus Paceibacterota bacterium]